MADTAIARLFIHGRSQAVSAGALRRGLTVVPANSSELRRVTGLNWEDWSCRSSTGPPPSGTSVGSPGGLTLSRPPAGASGARR